MSWHGLCVCFLPCLLLELGVLLGEAAVLVKTIHRTLKETEKVAESGVKMRMKEVPITCLTAELFV